jgi:DNA-directed RNA polymerase subunit F
MTPTGIALKVTDKNGNISFPSYEAHGWDKVNDIIQATLNMDNVAKVEIVNINPRKKEEVTA